MNREEAIEMWVIPALKNTWNEKKCNEVLEALEQEPVFFPSCQDCNAKMDEIRRAYDKLQKQEPCTDAISRQAYDKGFDDGLEEGLKVGACEDCIDRQYLVDKATSWDKHFDDSERYVSLTDIQNAPPVTPAEKVGHWTRELIRNEKGGCIGAKMICSRCGNDNRHDEYMNYCPNCGRKMEVEDE